MDQAFSDRVVMDGVKPGSSFVLAVLSGGVAAVVGSLLWMGVAVATDMNIGYVALGVGAVVGTTVRLAGRGRSFIFGVVGAVWTLVGCVGGEILATIQLATNAQASFMEVLMHYDCVSLAMHFITEASPLMYVIYAVGIFEGYKLSIRK